MTQPLLGALSWWQIRLQTGREYPCGRALSIQKSVDCGLSNTPEMYGADHP